MVAHVVQDHRQEDGKLVTGGKGRYPLSQPRHRLVILPQRAISTAQAQESTAQVVIRQAEGDGALVQRCGVAFLTQLVVQPGILIVYSPIVGREGDEFL